jgi:hypothetical protein
MKSLIFKLALPLTIFSITLFTKWWYVLVEDGPDEIFYGFPLPFVGPAWHTSMAHQIFLFELLVDFLFYFICWFIVIYTVNRFVIKLRINKAMSVMLPVASFLVIAGHIYFFIAFDNVMYLRRTFRMEIMETGFSYTWQRQEKPDYYKYHPEAKPK